MDIRKCSEGRQRCFEAQALEGLGPAESHVFGVKPGGARGTIARSNHRTDALTHNAALEKTVPKSTQTEPR
jgi:hypothetical protein